MHAVQRMIQSVTDLRIGQIGQGLGPRAAPSYDDSFLSKNCETAQRRNFTIYFETIKNGKRIWQP